MRGGRGAPSTTLRVVPLPHFVGADEDGDDSLPKPIRKGKLDPADYKKRLAAEKALQQRRYCNAFGLWRACALKACRRNAACRGDAHRCLKRAVTKVPRRLQWDTRETILKATPANIGAPERAARQCMPIDFYL